MRSVDVVYIQQPHAQQEVPTQILQSIHDLSFAAHHSNYQSINGPCGASGNTIDLKRVPHQLFSHPIVSVQQNSGVGENLDKNNNNNHSNLLLEALSTFRSNTIAPSSPSYQPHLPIIHRSQNNTQQQQQPGLVNILYDNNKYTWEEISRTQRHYIIATQPAYNANAKEQEHFYFNEKKLFVLTQKSHIEKGFCCENICKHCPYGFPEALATVGVTKLPPGRGDQDKGFLYPVAQLEPNVDVIMLINNNDAQQSAIILSRCFE